MVKSPHIKRIVFIGPECSGKSTMTQIIAEHFREPWSAEYVRKHVDQLDRPLDETDLEPIARGQIGAEDDAFSRAKEYVFHDTNILSSILYAEFYFDRHIKWVDQAFEARRYYVYFFCKPDIPWEADPGQRSEVDERPQLYSIFEQFLKQRKISYVELSGSLEQRKQVVIDFLKTTVNS